MTYTASTIHDEFRYYCYQSNFTGFIDFLNEHYDDVKSLTLDEIKSLLPIKHKGFNGTYFFPDHMIRHCQPTPYFPFSLEAKIYDWYGDRSTTDVVTANGNTEREIYERLLVYYMFRLQGYTYYHEAEREYSFILRRIRFFQNKQSHHNE